MTEANNIYYGTVKTFDLFKGYGFITREKGKDVFFFYGEIIHEEKYLTAGDKVSFELKMMDKGPRAFSIKKV